MTRLAVDMKGFVVLSVYRSTVKKAEQGKNTAMTSVILKYSEQANTCQVQKKGF